ncbi:DUF4435 domain-containing protein [Enterococcus faecalis]|uniref:DUF4435 domain-containing protein n=1 Tax=Enterococcus faecalis TX4248 TaxID=749495 RepID=A0A125W561_ENTFL|nr:DUF4435 domain-containing protein [Enterococcus faecalis]EFM82451.1 hypothetical protein HMPREF9498_01866 [Enterococcus faecalis TX4248]EGO5990412.1 DUF4435 domain-containing protein [Enterococcus faecalis]EGO6641101.1 DUF4435 domain-containing protein [Enterococcus faecalis]EGO8301462.1 DUF4435 domain-containing protein [Enterococcus faecalis]EGO8757503.1 DUF4435 domain-containing protein [Enterococcus faecalis]
MSDLLTEMKESKNEVFGAVFQEFINEYRHSDYTYFCFIEGEDEKYYHSRFQQYLGKGTYRCYDSNGKKNVLKLYKKLRGNTSYDKLKLMFFVDRDYDFQQSEENDLYVTPCYSIENLYVNMETFQDILSVEFCVKKDTEKFNEYKQLMESIFKSFNEGILEYNALGKIKRENGISNSVLKLSDYPTKYLFKLEEHRLVKHQKYDSTVQEMREKLEVNDIQVDNAKKFFTKRKNFWNDFRGKNQLDIFVSVLKFIKEKENKNIKNENHRIHDGETSGVMKRSIHLTITSNKLTELSQYAITPECLQSFLYSHK